MPVYKPKGRKNYTYEFWIKGVRFREGTRTADKKTAEAIEAAARRTAEKAQIDAAAGIRPRTELSLNEALERYYQEVGQFAESAGDIDRELEELSALGGAKRLSEIGDPELAAFVAAARGRKVKVYKGRDRRGNKRLGEGKRLVSNRTVNSQVETLRAVYRRAQEIWKANVGEPPQWRKHLLPEPSGRVRELTADEEAKLFEALRPDYHPLVRFALATGLRLSNCIKLTWSEVDLAAGVITVRVKDKSHAGGRIHQVPIVPTVAAMLAAERGRNPFRVFTYECRRNRGGPTGPQRKGRRYPFTKNGWRKPWRAALEAAGIADFRFHDLRHTRATRTARHANLKVVQTLLGHADIQSTARYAHAQVADVRRALEAEEHHHIPTGLPRASDKGLK